MLVTTKTIPVFSGDIPAGTPVKITSEYVEAHGEKYVNFVTVNGGRIVHGLAAECVEEKQESYCPWDGYS